MPKEGIARAIGMLNVKPHLNQPKHPYLISITSRFIDEEKRDQGSRASAFG
jgi:hypothetical protein